ncbi:MAG TPA: glycerophosphodiester phosphodiesterase family protein [Solirubrobacteraceae bacterium]|nr:glycerophosphodiester phosphodiesterase family protein [Solirubrobacteraceae bacterium]
MTSPRKMRFVLAVGAALGLTAATPNPAHGATPDERALEEHFDGAGLPAGFAPVEGNWTVENGRLVGVSSSAAQISRLTFGPRLENFRFEATVRFESVVNATRWTALALDMRTGGAPPWSHAALRTNSSAANGTEFAIRTAANTWNVTDTAAAPADAGTGKDVRVAIEVRGSSGTWSFDGRQLMTTRSIERSADGALGFVVNGAKVSFDDVVVTKLAPESLVLPDDDETLPRVIAHRGYSAITPENTLAAMTTGAKVGADYVETDVGTNADGVPYILHDATVDRTTDGTGALNALRTPYLDGLDAGSWFAPSFTGQELPTLDALLDEVKRGGARLLLEIKGPETDAEVARIVEAVRAKGLAGRTLVQSFDESVVKASAKADPAIPVALLRSALDADPVAKAKELGVVAYNPAWPAIKPKPQTIKALNEAGIAVMPYTVDNADEWALMRDAGVDGIITNRPGELIGWSKRYAQGGRPLPVAAGIAAPDDGAQLERGDDVSVALELTGAESVTQTLDGEPVAEGDTIDTDLLALGTHDLTVVATGAHGDQARATSTFTLRASGTGLAHRVATAPGLADKLRIALLDEVLDDDWTGVRRLVARRLDGALAAQLDGDAAALGGADPSQHSGHGSHR